MLFCAHPGLTDAKAIEAHFGNYGRQNVGSDFRPPPLHGSTCLYRYRKTVSIYDDVNVFSLRCVASSWVLNARERHGIGCVCSGVSRHAARARCAPEASSCRGERRHAFRPLSQELAQAMIPWRARWPGTSEPGCCDPSGCRGCRDAAGEARVVTDAGLRVFFRGSR